MNLCAFLAFGLDKHRAASGGRRLPEARLLSLAWAGGLAGAWTGMAIFRHKTRKTSFRIKMLLATVFNLGWPVAWWLLSRPPAA